MKLIAICLLLVGLVFETPAGWCGEPDSGWKSVGIMEGFRATRRKEFFHAYEALAAYGLPWSLRTDSGWGAALQIGGTAGVLRAADETGAICSLGLNVVFDKVGNRGVALELGGAVDVLGRRRFGYVDLNGNPLYDAHGGIAYRFESGPGVFYRFFHMSNGGMGLHGYVNTGLDMHMIGINWNF